MLNFWWMSHGLEYVVQYTNSCLTREQSVV